MRSATDSAETMGLAADSWGTQVTQMRPEPHSPLLLTGVEGGPRLLLGARSCATFSGTRLCTYSTRLTTGDLDTASPREDTRAKFSSITSRYRRL